MQLVYGNMWDIWDSTDCFLITTNSTTKNDGSLVMGRGIARQARDRFPGIDTALGLHIILCAGHLGRYGIVTSPHWASGNNYKLAAFQVKTHYSNKTDLNLITYSCLRLNRLAKIHPLLRFDLNFPGIGNGKLSRDLVLPTLEHLPDNVHIWQYRP